MKLPTVCTAVQLHSHCDARAPPSWVNTDVIGVDRRVNSMRPQGSLVRVASECLQQNSSDFLKNEG